MRRRAGLWVCEWVMADEFDVAEVGPRAAAGLATSDWRALLMPRFVPEASGGAVYGLYR